MSNGGNNFKVSYSEIAFLESVLAQHTAVSEFSRTQDILFEIERRSRMSSLSVVLVSEYRLGEAFAYEVLRQFPNADIIVNNGKWNAVTLNAREFKANTGIEVLKINQFLAALNNPNTGR